MKGKEMEHKKYKVGTFTLTQGELSMNDGKKALRLLKDINWEGIFTSEKTIYETMVELLDDNLLEQLFDICLKGKRPKGEIGDWMTAGMAMEVASDFFDLNASLMTNAGNFLSNLQLSAQGSVDQKLKSTD